MIEASCHCGAVRFRIAKAPDTVTDCNCSLCRRLGALWAYYTVDEVEVLAAPEATLTYIQGDATLANHSCATCRCTTHWKGLGDYAHRIAVNSRLMDPDVMWAAKIKRLDGAGGWACIIEDQVRPNFETLPTG